MTRLGRTWLFCIGLCWWGAAHAAGDAPLRVMVSIAPLQTFVTALGGDQVQVQVLLPPGRGAENFEPSPRQIAALADSDLFVRTGVAFENAWMDRTLAVNSRMKILDLREGLPLRDADHQHTDDPADAHEEKDPHVWTSPPLVKQMSAAIRDQLTQLRPSQEAAFAAGYVQFTAELDRLDQELRASLQDLPQRRFLVLHPAWGYFADTYGLVQIPVERDGKEPGAQALAELVDEARRDGLKVIFVQPQFNPKAAETLAQAIGGRIEVLDDLAPDYAANLRRAARLLVEAARP